MAPLLGAGLISGIGSLFGGLLGMQSQSNANDANMELAKYAFDRNVDMWNMQNEYNTPAKQMERLKAAGLNPNLVYGSGSVAGNNAGSPPSYSAPHINPVSNGGFISDAVQHGLYTSRQLENLDAQNELTHSQVSVQEAQIAKSAAETASILQDTARNKFDLDLSRELRQNTVEVANANLKKIHSDINRNSIDSQYKKAELALLPLKAKLTDAQYNQLLIATGKAAWELQQEKEGRFVGTDFWSNIGNQALRASRGESNMFDTLLDKISPSNLIKKLGKSLFSKWWK